MNTQPQLLRKKHIRYNSLQRRLEQWLKHYQGTSPIDGQLMFEQLGLEYTRKNYKKFYGALWELNHDETKLEKYAMDYFYFAEFEPREGFYTEKAKEVMQSNNNGANGGCSGKPKAFAPISLIQKSEPFDVLQSCYRQLAQLSKEDANKIIQSLTIML